MKRKTEELSPVAPGAIETLGGAYHLLESSFRPRHKAPAEGKPGGRKDSDLDQARKTDIKEERP